MLRKACNDNSKTILGLSPMDGITDCTYREMCKSSGSVDLLYTEFQNVHGLSLAVPKLWNAFQYTEFQRPILAQIYGHEPEYFFPAALLCLVLGFDGVDINMGCPAKKISDRGAGAGLIRTPEIAKQIIYEVKRAREIFQQEIIPIISQFESYNEISNNLDKTDLVAVFDNAYKKINSNCFANLASTDLLPTINWKKLLKLVLNLAVDWKISLKRVVENSSNLTISVKTRIGYDKPSVETWIPKILETKPDFIALHGRTLKQLYTGVADYNSIAKAVEICHKENIPIFANGDINSVESAKSCLEITKADGILIGRGSYGKPEIFSEIKDRFNLSSTSCHLPLSGKPQIHEKFEQILKHCELFDRFNPHHLPFQMGQTNFFPMRKILCWYIKDIPNASELRKKLVLASSSKEVREILEDYKNLNI